MSVASNIKVDSIRTNACGKDKALLMLALHLLSLNIINTSLIVMRECPYTALSQDVSKNTPPSALEIALGQSLGLWGTKSRPREISRAEWGAFSYTSLLSAVYGFNTTFIASGDAVNILHNPEDL